MEEQFKIPLLLISLLHVLHLSAYGQDTTSVILQNEPKRNLPTGISSDDFVFRIGYAYGPEYLFVLFPPIKLGIEYHSPKLSAVYIGFDGSLNGLVAFWLQTGLYAGVKYRNVTLETKINHLFAVSPERQTTKIWSLNPKIGIDYRKFYMKIGPYFPVYSYGDRELNKKPYLSLDGTLINIDVGIRFPANKR